MLRLIGLCAALLLLPACATPRAAAPPKRIAFSFDDVPRPDGAFMSARERADRLIRGLRRAGVRQAAFFATPGNVEKAEVSDGEARIAAYAAAGHVVANHSWSHRWLSRTPLPDYLADIDRAEAWLAGRPGHRPWFRTPFLDQGQRDAARRDGLRAGLRARGLRNGYVTVDGSDWHIDARAAQAVRDGRRLDMAVLRDLYVETMVEAAETYDALAVRATGRSPVHMLLLHENDLAALFIGDLVAGFAARGWTVATADDAYADPIGRHDPVVPSAQGTLVELIAWEAGLPPPRWYERNDTGLADRLFDARVLGEDAVDDRGAGAAGGVRPAGMLARRP